MGKLFNYVIGNPPYQEDTEGTSDAPVYDSFMSAAYEVSDKTMLITPARFLFNAGKTPKEWNAKMLADPHLKVEYYEHDSSKLFPNTNITGGVAVTYHDWTKNFDPIDVFSSHDEMKAIIVKIRPHVKLENLSSIIHLQNRFNLHLLYQDHPEFQTIISNGGKERRIVSSSFEKLSVFHDEKTEEDLTVLGVMNGNQRVYRYIQKQYVEDNGNLNRWKVLVPKSNGSGAIGEVIPTQLIGQPMMSTPNEGYTQSFVGIGSFSTHAEAEACLKYVKSKFARTMLGILKITQDNPPEKWRYVPLQDFTENSDIDWSQTIPNIDRQLYAKYGLDETEIDFIETHVKEMT